MEGSGGEKGVGIRKRKSEEGGNKHEVKGRKSGQK
jgi:hypothetical protein